MAKRMRPPAPITPAPPPFDPFFGAADPMGPVASLDPDPFAALLPPMPDGSDFDPFAPPPMVAPEPELLDPEPEEDGLLSKIGYALDTPGALFRGAMAGRPGTRASTQDLFKEYGLTETADAPLLSWQGGAGLIGDIVLDPANLLPGFFGLKAATKAGRSAQLVGKHLAEAGTKVDDALRTAKIGAGRSRRAAQEAFDAGNEFEEIPTPSLPTVKDDVLGVLHRGSDAVDPSTGEVLAEAGRVGDRAIVEGLAQRQDDLGRAAQDLISNQQARGISDDVAFRPLDNAADRVRAGQEAFLSAGGDVDPFALFRLGGNLNPINYLPEIPGFTAPLKLPEVTIAEAPQAAQLVQDAWRGLGNLPGIKQAGELFSQVPGKISPETRKIINELLQTSRREVAEGEAVAAREAQELTAEIDSTIPGPIPKPPPAPEVLLPGQATSEEIDDLLRQAEEISPPPRPQVKAPPVDDIPVESPPISPPDDLVPSVKPQPDRVYREIGPDQMREYLPDSKGDSLVDRKVYFSSSPDFALGQGNNKGIMLEFDRTNLQLTAETSKPGAGLVPGFDELVGVHSLPEYRQALRKITLPKNLVAPEGALSLLDKRAAWAERMQPFVERGEWKKTVTDDGVVYEKVSAPPDTAQMGSIPPRSASRPDYIKRGSEGDTLLKAADGAAPAKNADAIAARTPDTDPDELLKKHPDWSRQKAQDVASSNYQRNLRTIGTQRDARTTAPYLDDAGQGTAAAAVDAAKLDQDVMDVELTPAGNQVSDAGGLAPSVRARVTRVIERGGEDAPEVKAIADKITKQYETMLQAEQKTGLDTSELQSKDGKLGYTTHVTTEQGRKFFNGVARNKKKAAALFMELEKVREVRGIARNPDALNVPQTKTPGKKSKEPAKPINPRLQAESLKELDGLDAATKDFIIRNNLQKEFNDFSRDISNTHPSQIARLPAYRDLSVEELNRAFRKFGAKVNVFEENPAVQLFTRRARHVKAMAGQAFADRAAEAIGQEMKDAPRTPQTNGLEKIGDKVGITKLNEQRIHRGLAPIGFDPETAEALASVLNRMENPEEVHELVKWYDSATRVMKSYLTRMFPAYHVGNHISNHVQSWLGGVPLNAPEGAEAMRILAGKDVTITLPEGTFTRDQILQRYKESGSSSGGFYENLVEESARNVGQDAKARTFNPLDPENFFVRGAEKVSSAIAAGPGMIAAGASSGLKESSGKMLEESDRLRHWLFKKRQGFSDQAAAADVDKYLFDYSRESLSPVEQKYLSRAAFFYNYTRNVIPLILDTAGQDLRKVAAVTKLGQQPGKPEYLPGYANEGLNVPMSVDSEGNKVVAATLRTPVEAAVEPFAKNPLTLLNPLLKAPLELASGLDFFLDRPIADARKAPHFVDELPQELQDILGVEAIAKTDRKGQVMTGLDGAPIINYEADPYALWAVRNSPASRLVNTGSRMFDERKGILENLLNLTTGARLVSVDEEDEIERLRKKRKTEESAERSRARKKAAAQAALSEN